MQFRRLKQPIDGVLFLDKPAGWSSNQALQRVKSLLQAAKAGHTGSLDPFATGLLPICLGEATKFSHFLLDADKTYRATLRLGVTTSTGDTEGVILSDVPVDVTAQQFEQALHRFRGRLSQVPPMYSALKYQGKPLYEYARAGVEVARPARDVTIHALTLNRLAGTEADITVSCSKGTYIRTLAEDIGKALGCGAYLTALRRVHIGSFDLSVALALDQLEAMPFEQRKACLLGVDALVKDFPAITLDDESAYYLCRGQPVWKSGQIPDGPLRLYAGDGRFLGLGERDDDGRVLPRRLVNLAQAARAQ